MGRLQQFCDRHYNVQYRAARVSYRDLLEYYQRVEREYEAQRQLERQMVRGLSGSSNSFQNGYNQQYPATVDESFTISIDPSMEQTYRNLTTSSVSASSSLTENDIERAVNTLRESVPTNNFYRYSEWAEANFNDNGEEI
jgi:hypothetical protein